VELADIEEKVKGKSKKAKSKTPAGKELFLLADDPLRIGLSRFSKRIEDVCLRLFLLFPFDFFLVKHCWWHAATQPQREVRAARGS
jgi:hypothetical protein